MQKPSEQLPYFQTSICPPVAEVFGTDPGLAQDLMHDRGGATESSEIADVLRGLYAADFNRPAEAYLSGASADRVIKSLGCESCVLAGVCLVENALIEATPNAKKLDIATQLLSAPSWLKTARGSTRLDGVPVAALDSNTLLEAIESGELSRADILGGVISSPLGLARVTDIPELAGFAYGDKNKDVLLERTLVTPINGQAPPVEVIDASSLIDHGKIRPADARHLAVLYRKLLTNIAHVGPSNESQILDPDAKMQKQLRSQPNGPGKFFELRMSGKSRLYLTVTPPSDTLPCRIVIIGSHDDNEANQQTFIDASLARR